MCVPIFRKGAVARFITSFFTCPFEVLRTNLQAAVGQSPQGGGKILHENFSRGGGDEEVGLNWLYVYTLFEFWYDFCL